MSEKAIYKQGYRAAELGRNKSPPAELSWKDRHWWLAGFGDWEIENVVDKE